MCDQPAAPPASEGRRVGDYVLLEPIGEGSFAAVWLARHTPTGAEVAVKVTQRRGSCDPFAEVRSLQLLRHPNIVTLFEVIATEDELYLVQELVRGDLFRHLGDQGHLTEDEARHTFRQVISAIQYCHQWHIAHRDIKPENILVDRDNNVRVADFGCSAQTSQERPLLCSFCGTFPYMAPELLQYEPHDHKVDVWSLGIVLYQMLTGQIPFEDQNHDQHRSNILSGRFPVPQSLSLDCQGLLKKLLVLDPDERPTLEHIMRDRWVNLGEGEELSPYCEPPRGGLDPNIIEIMTRMGFEEQEIQKSVTEKKYDHIMGTYLILSSTPPKMKGRTIKVRSCPFPDPNINILPTQGGQTSGQSDRDPAIAPAGLGSRVPTPSPYQLVRKKHIPLVMQEANLSTSSSSQESGNETLPASQVVMPTTPRPSRETETTTPRPSREAETTTPRPSWEVMPTTPRPSWEVMPTTPRPSWEVMPTTPRPSRETETTTPRPSREAETTTSRPSWETETTTSRPSWEVMPTTPRPSWEVMPTTPRPSRETETTTPRPSREAETTTSRPSWETETTTSRPSWEVMPTTPRPSREAETTTPRPSWETETTTPRPSWETETTTSRPSWETETTTPRPSWETETTTSRPSWEVMPTTPRPSWETETTTPRPSWETETTTPRPSREAETTTPPASWEATSVLGPNSWTATASAAPPGDPRGSPTPPSTSRAAGAPENTAAHPDAGPRASPSARSQGRQGVVRRVFRRLLGLLCCVPTSDRPGLRRTRVAPM